MVLQPYGFGVQGHILGVHDPVVMLSHPKIVGEQTSGEKKLAIEKTGKFNVNGSLVVKWVMTTNLITWDQIRMEFEIYGFYGTFLLLEYLVS